MPAVTDYSSTYTSQTARKPMVAPLGGHFDFNLLLENAVAITVDGQSTAIDVEGGSFAEWVIVIGAVTGTTPTLLLHLQASIDGGSNYFRIASSPSLDNNDANTQLARPAYIPRPTAGTNRITKVRHDRDVGGTTPSFTITAFLRDLGVGMDGPLETLT